MNISSLVSESSKDSALIAGMDWFFRATAPGDTLLTAMALIMRPWLLQNGYDAAAEFLDTGYLATQCTAVSDAGLQERIDAYRRTSKGKTAPDIILGADSVSIRKLSDLHSKNILVIFWASWCQHCAESLPAIYDYTVQKGVSVVAVSLDQNVDAWKKATRSFPGWIHVRAGESWNDPRVKLYGVFGTPTIFVLDANGVILGKVSRLDDLRGLIW